ncbi:hypothetical protein [Phytobacter sp. RSE-02]|uniref:hypothetical protein n=1 Tax=Phytobacter sp. RSE-02 TaxID=3229229 RepID=UPI00339D3623
MISIDLTALQRHRSRDEASTLMDEINKILEEAAKYRSSFFDFLKDFSPKDFTQNLSIKNEKFRISIPLITLILLIARLIVFKIAIMYKVMQHKTLEFKVVSRMTKNQHSDLLSLNKILASGIVKENACQA